MFLVFFEREIIAPKKSVWMRVKERFHIHDKDVPAQEEDVNISLRCKPSSALLLNELKI